MTPESGNPFDEHTRMWSDEILWGPLLPVVKWLLERALPPHDGNPCTRCGHDAHYHRLDDSTNVAPTDPAAKFRCIWPMPDGPAVQLCACPNHITTAAR